MSSRPKASNPPLHAQNDSNANLGVGAELPKALPYLSAATSEIALSSAPAFARASHCSNAIVDQLAGTRKTGLKSEAQPHSLSRSHVAPSSSLPSPSLLLPAPPSQPCNGYRPASAVRLFEDPVKAPPKNSKRTREMHLDSGRESKYQKRDDADPDPSTRSNRRVDAAPTISPRLCPYCDAILPKHPSSVFEELLQAARAKSWHQPRSTNPFALKAASLQVYVGVCERHKFEANVLPRAIRAGWPTTIDFDLLPARVKRLRHVLDNIIDNPSSSSFFHEAMQRARQVGIRVAESAMGQYAAFQRLQPGYYGERGAMVLHQTLRLLYPPQVLQDAHGRFAPLSTMSFQTAVLMPEAALALIMEDCGATRVDALKTMRASSSYGSMMFPDDDEEESLVDAMMRELAKQRRAEIEAEEAAEAVANELGLDCI